jgi:hypothetical protein
VLEYSCFVGVFLFWGRLDCRFSFMVFIVKRRSKTSDCLTRINLDLSTPPFYSLKRRKKAGFRTQSHSIDNHSQHIHTYTHTKRYMKRTGTMHNMEVIVMYINAHLRCIQVACKHWLRVRRLCRAGGVGGRRLAVQGRREDDVGRR